LTVDDEDSENALVDDLDPRRRRLWGLHNFSDGRGLEIGPLHSPIVRKHEAAVHYVDIKDQEGLRAYYDGHVGITVEDIPEIDYPLTQPDGNIASLVEATKAGAPFDWCVASHVVEHVPDLIGWLEELAEVTVDGGALVLVVPDRRYCFDVHRPPTSVGAMLEANLLGSVRPGVRAVYDHYSKVVQYNVVDLWRAVLPSYDQRYHTPAETDALVQQSLHDYVDAHVWLFTPTEFVEQLHELRVIGRSQWYVEEVFPTPRNDIEFMVRLRRLARGADSRGPVDGELLPTNIRPDWLEDRARTGQLKVLRKRVRKLRARVTQRSAQVQRLRAAIARQQEVIRRQRAELEQVRGSLPVRMTRAAGKVRKRLRRPH
jgi:hypothetical protein